jgi:hypothetical protein
MNDLIGVKKLAEFQYGAQRVHESVRADAGAHFRFHHHSPANPRPTATKYPGSGTTATSGVRVRYRV